jgi:hypothetical protein
LGGWVFESITRQKLFIGTCIGLGVTSDSSQIWALPFDLGFAVWVEITPQKLGTKTVSKGIVTFLQASALSTMNLVLTVTVPVPRSPVPTSYNWPWNFVPHCSLLMKKGGLLPFSISKVWESCQLVQWWNWDRWLVLGLVAGRIAGPYQSSLFQRQPLHMAHQMGP